MNVIDKLEILKTGCTDIINVKELEKKLKSTRKLIVKLGCDPTSPDLHLGHSIALSKMRAFEDMGHTGVLVIGDFTAGIGDPSGRDATRPVLTAEQIKQNAETYTKQAFKILDDKKTAITFNAQWLRSFVGGASGGTSNMLNSLSKITVSRLLEREDFKNRIKQGNPITMLEILYPVFQGYDSVALKADVELGGSDQLFNLIVGRDMQKIFGQDPQVVMTVPLLTGTDGVKKMSKSYGNYIGLTETSKDMFGKIMSVSDELMWTYYELLTDSDLAKFKKLHPMEAKKNLARTIVAKFHNEEKAQKELDEFENVFSAKNLPKDIKVFELEKGIMLADIICKVGFAKSKNEARRLIGQGAVKIDGRKTLSDEGLPVKDEAVLQVGRKNFCKIKLKK